jgi:hypothetical protein
MKNGGAMLTVENNAGIAWLFKPCATRYRVKFNIIAGVYPGARLGATARVFGAHAFNCHLTAPSSTSQKSQRQCQTQTFTSLHSRQSTVNSFLNNFILQALS